MTNAQNETLIRTNKRLTIINPVVFTVLALLVCCAGATNKTKASKSTMPKDSNYSWRQSDDSLALLNYEHIVWQLNYKKQEGKPYFHPLGLADGTELTWLRPPDHAWHRGIWFSWKFINGLNYWNPDMLSEGRTEVVDVKVNLGTDHSARIEMALNYHPPGKPAVLKEKRLLTVGALDKNGRYHIDWHSTFTAGEQDVLLDRTPIPSEKDGKVWGGYAGLSFRMGRGFSTWQIVDSQSRKVDSQNHGKKARWLDFNGEMTTGKTAGIAIFDHPDNLRHPSPWYADTYVMKGKGPYIFFGPAVLFDKPYTLSAEKSLTLRYRILIYPGRADKDLLESEWKKLCALKK